LIILTENEKFANDNEVKEKVERFAFDIILKCLLGDVNNDIQISAKNDTIFKTMIDLNDILSEYLYNPVRNMFITRFLPFGLGYWVASFFIESFRREFIATKSRDEYIAKMISKAQNGINAGEENTDLASILARMKNNDGTNTYSIPEMTAHLHTFIFAGFDTTASTLHWILFYVGKYPAYAKRVANELEENGGRINAKTLKNIPFTTAFIKEVLRLTHIVDCIVPREALIDIELPNGDIMPAGTNFTVDISVMAVKNDPWGSDALEFNPDRYKETELHPYQNIPFSAGRRNCIGQGFAMQEMKIMLLRLCSRIKIENDVIEPDLLRDRPVSKQNFLWKVKPNTLNQKFTYYTA